MNILIYLYMIIIKFINKYKIINYKFINLIFIKLLFYYVLDNEINKFNYKT